MSKETKYPTDDEIDKLVDSFTDGLDLSKSTARIVRFGYQEGLYKMRQIWKKSNESKS